MTHNIYIKFNGSIYKKYREYNFEVSNWIKMTNIDDFKNRLITMNTDFNEEKYKYGYVAARREINKYWNSLNHTWTFNGEEFDNHIDFTTENVPHKINNYKYYVVWYRGNLYWMVMYHYFPMCQLYEFKSIDEKPGNFIKWTNVKHLKSVFNKTQHKIV